MVKSMTAFARRETSAEWGELSIELRTVNHRYLDISLRMPEELRILEPKLRELISGRLARGKVECNVRYKSSDASQNEFVINKDLASHLAKASREVDALLYSPSPINSLDVLRWPGVLVYPEKDMGPVQEAVLNLAGQALDDLVSAREREGEKLKAFILERCQSIAEEVARVKQILPEIMANWHAKLQKRLQDLASEVDENRLAQETAMMAQKMDVDEEVDRIGAHLEEIKRVLNNHKPMGRRLDFLIQELHREANTLGSKSIDTESTKASVELKVLIEQAREQVQNIE